MKNLYKQKRQQGFTIIEVLIVLAIAALILLIVFLAVPALQRNSRNTGRNNEAARVASATNTWVANNNATTPTTANAGAAILTDVGTFNQYNGIAAQACTLTDNVSDFCIVPQVAATPYGAFTGTTSLNDMRVVTAARCSTVTTGATVAGATREMALQYSTESGGGAINANCVTI